MKEAEANLMNKQGSEIKIWNKQFVIILLVNTAIFLSFNMATAGFPAFVSAMANSHLTTGLVTTVSALGALLLRPIAGYILDRRLARLFSLLGLLLMAAPLFCLLSPDTATVLVVRFLQGAGWGLASTACSRAIANSLPHERLSEGIGYAGFLSSAATAFAPGIALSIGEKSGFDVMFGIIGISAVGAAILYLFSRHGGEERIASAEKQPSSFIPILRETYLPALLIMTVTVAYAPMVTFIKPYAASLGIGSTAAYFFAYACATVIARPLTGLYVDRKNADLPAITALISIAAASVLLSICRSLTVLLMAAVLSGVGTGAGMNSLQTMSVKSTAAANRGMAMAIFLFGFDLGMAAGSFVAGLISNYAGFPKLFLIMAFPPAVACMIYAITLKRKAKGHDYA